MILALIQARQGSTRLPGKSMLTIGGKPLIEYVIERVRAANLVNFLCVATTDKQEDDALAAHVESLGVDVFRGNSEDLVSRFYWASQRYPQAEAIVRITADDPFKDPDLIDLAIELFLTEWAKPDKIEPPQLMHLGGISWMSGMDVEIFTKGALEAAYKEAPTWNREHSTAWMATALGVWILKDWRSRSSINTKLSIDDLNDYSLCLGLAERLGEKNYSYDATLAALAEIQVAA